MNDKPDLEKGIYRVSVNITRAGVRWSTEGDLIFVDDQPILVLEWQEVGERQFPHPELSVPLDLDLLEPIGETGYLLYRGEVADPRSSQ